MIILDTHAWIWWADDSAKLSARARKAIEQADSLGVAAVSCWELGMLVAKGRLTLDRDVAEWMSLALRLPASSRSI